MHAAQHAECACLRACLVRAHTAARAHLPLTRPRVEKSFSCARLSLLSLLRSEGGRLNSPFFPADACGKGMEGNGIVHKRERIARARALWPELFWARLPFTHARAHAPCRRARP